VNKDVIYAVYGEPPICLIGSYLGVDLHSQDPYHGCEVLGDDHPLSDQEGGGEHMHLEYVTW